MSIFQIVMFAFAGVSLFVLGWKVGIQTSRTRYAGDENECLSEAIKLWRDANAKTDEMARRNVVELGSVRERLADVNRSMKDSRVFDSIGELTDRIYALENEIHGLRMPSEADFDGILEHRPANSPSAVSAVVSDAKGTGNDHCRASFFDRFVSRISKKVELETPFVRILDFVYDNLQTFVSYQRMGYAEIDYEADRVSAKWYRSERPVRLKAGYSAELSKSSLQFVAGQNRPRVLLNLHDYLLRHPNSHSTRLLVDEGFGSSLTFPVAVNETVVGFLFLTSVDVDGFDDEDVKRVRDVVKQIGRVAILDKEALPV